MDKRIIIFCLCTLIPIFVIPSVIFAASFDCSKASSKTEKVICDDPILSKLDEDMAAAYSKALRTNASDAKKMEQRKWLKDTLSPCREDKECIQKAYENRIHQLNQSAGSLKSEPPLFEGLWSAAGRAFWGYDFSIKNGKISFVEQGCLNNSIDVIESLDGVITSWNGKPENVYTYVIRIHYSKSRQCNSVEGYIGQYIRMNISKNYLCWSSTYFYQDLDTVNKDKANNWNGNYSGGWSGFGYAGNDRECDTRHTDGDAAGPRR